MGTKAAVAPGHTVTAMWAGSPKNAKAVPHVWLAKYLAGEFGELGAIHLQSPFVDFVSSTRHARLLTAENMAKFDDEMRAAAREKRRPRGVMRGGRIFSFPHTFGPDGNRVWFTIVEDGDVIAPLVILAADQPERFAANKRAKTASCLKNSLLDNRSKARG